MSEYIYEKEASLLDKSLRSVADLSAEIERLQDENQQLRRANDEQNDPHRKCVISLKEGHLFEIMKRHYSILAYDQDSWGELLKSKHHNRRQKVAEKLYEHFVRMLIREKPWVRKYSFCRVVLRGSLNKLDVKAGRCQAYDIFLSSKCVD